MCLHREADPSQRVDTLKGDDRRENDLDWRTGFCDRTVKWLRKIDVTVDAPRLRSTGPPRSVSGRRALPRLRTIQTISRRGSRTSFSFQRPPEKPRAEIVVLIAKIRGDKRSMRNAAR